MSFSLTTSLRADGFSLEASPSTVYLKQDEKATSTITVHPSGAFNGSVTLLASRLPTGVTASFDPESTTSASTLVFVAAKEATTGLSSIVITGTSGNLTQSATISLAVTAANTALEWRSIYPQHTTCPNGTSQDVFELTLPTTPGGTRTENIPGNSAGNDGGYPRAVAAPGRLRERSSFAQ